MAASATSIEYVEKMFIAYFGRPAAPTGLEYYAGLVDAGKVAALQDDFWNSAESQNLFGSHTTEAKINAIFQQLFGRDAAVSGLTYWTTQISSGAVSLPAAALTILNSAGAADLTAFNAKLLVANAFTAQLDTSAEVLSYQQNISGGYSLLGTIHTDTDATAALAVIADSVATVVAGGSSNPGQTFTFTTGADNIAGTSGNDTINGNTADTWTGFDAIDGGAGTDTMNVLLTGTAVPGASTITNVENLNINTTGAGFTIDTTSYTGMTAVKVASSAAGAISVTGATTTSASVVGTGASSVAVFGTGGALSVTTGAAAVDIGQTAVVNALTSATVVGGTTVKISDNKTTTTADGTTLTTVSLKGNTGAATLDTDGLTTLTLTNNTQNATVNAIAGTRALTLNLDGATGGIIADDLATTLNVNATGTKSSGVTLNAAKATTVAVNAGVDLTVADVNIDAATAVTIAGAGKTTISATTTVTALTSIDASASTGGAIITPVLGTGVAFTGGAGADKVSIAAGGTKAIAMGDGNDTVTYGGALAAGGSIDGGLGTSDTIAMSAAAAVTATGSTTFAGTVAGFEVLEVNAATGAAAALNMANADGINNLVLNGVTVGALTVTNAAANFSYTNKAAVGVASSIALASDVGTNDTVNVTYTAADGFADTAAMTIANVENINITTKDADTTAQTTQFTAIITAAAATNVVISGDTGVVFTNTATTITNLDASGLTGTVAAASGLTWTTGALAAAATIKGSAAATNTVDFSAATKAVTYTGGTGNDAITANVTGAAATIDLGNGTNSVTGGSATKALTVTGGTGVDTITTGSGADTINAGAGNDIINSGTGLDIITGGAGNDNFTINANANGNIFATITDAAVGDILTFTDKGAETFATAKLTLGGTAVFQDYLNLAAAGDGSTNGALSWFQFGGNTYVVEDVSAGASFVNGGDLVVQLTGLIDLSTATGAGTHVLTLA